MTTINVHITLEQLRKKGYISLNLFNVCGRNGMHTLDSLKSHWKVYGTFQNLEAVGLKSAQQLHELLSKDMAVLKIADDEPSDFPPKEDTIDDYQKLEDAQKNLFQKFFIYRLNHLSARASNLLSKLFELRDLDEKLQILLHHDFTAGKVRNMGSITIEALHLFQQDIINLINELKKTKDLDLGKIQFFELRYRFSFGSNPLQLLSDSKLELISRKLNVWINHLSVRARNILLHIKTSSNFRYPIVKFLFNDKEDAYSVRGAGERCFKEFDQLKASVKDYIYKMEATASFKTFFTTECAKIAFEALTGRNPDLVPDTDLYDSIIDVKDSFNYFAFLDLLFSNNYIFNQNEQIIFDQLYKKDNEHSQTENSEDLLPGFTLTKERGRQISATLHKKISELLTKLEEYYIIDIQTYFPTQSVDFIILSESMGDGINTHNGVHFNILFYEIVFCYLSKGTYPLFDEKAHRITTPVKHDKRYLFSKNILDNWDAYGFIRNIKSLKHNSRIKANSRLTDYLIPYLQGKKKVPAKIISIARNILTEGLAVPVNEENILYPSKSEAIRNHIFDFLESQNKPLHIREILAGLNAQYPDMELNRGKLLFYLKDRSIYTIMGRNSRYGLKKWETEKSDFKGGTIRTIVIEFLKSCDTPQGSKAIMNHVSRYRPKTYLNSIRSNIHLDTSDTFIFFPNGKIGLKDKQYRPEVIHAPKEKRVLKKKRLSKEKGATKPKKVTRPKNITETRITDPWQAQFKKLAKFIKNNEGRWPSYASDDLEEKALYTFITKNGILLRNGLLSSDKITALERIGIKYRV